MNKDLCKMMNPYCVKSLLGHDKLKVKSEHDTVGMLWNYASITSVEDSNYIVPAIRWEFLNYQDLLVLARDHKIIRQSENFKYAFTKEHQRRAMKKPRDANPRAYFAPCADEEIDYNKDLVGWLLNANHHEGYEKRVDELKKRCTVNKVEQKPPVRPTQKVETGVNVTEPAKDCIIM